MRGWNFRFRAAIGLAMACGIFAFSGCSRWGNAGESRPAANEGQTKIVVQTDWYAQPEHGGFYQALVKGYYRDVGLDVAVLQGGPNAMTLEKIALGKADISLDRSDRVLVNASRGIPLQILGALMQKDPQALMVHADSGIENFEDLDGMAIMATPGATYLSWLRQAYEIDFRVIPHTFGMDRFVHDRDLVQQAFVTNEPYYVAREGADPRVLLLSASGFSPYRVWYARSDFVKRNPEAVKAFNAATIKGWREYMFGDREEADALIASLNPKMDEDFMNYAHQQMLAYGLVTGDGGDPETIGRIDPRHLERQIRQLEEAGLLEGPIEADALFDPALVPDGIGTAAVSDRSTNE